MSNKRIMINYEEVKANRDSFLNKNKKHGLEALKTARGVKDYKELADKLKCNTSMASTMINELLSMGLYERNKEGKLKRTKGLIRVGVTPRKTNNEIVENIVKTRKVRKSNHKIVKKEIIQFIVNNFKKIRNPFNKLETQSLTEIKLKESGEFLIQTLDANLNFESI